MNKFLHIFLATTALLWIPNYLSSQEPNTNKSVMLVKPNWAKEQPEVHSKPENAIRDFQGDLVPYVLWVDPYLWHEVRNINIHAEKSFKTENGEVVGLIVVHSRPVNLEKLHEIAVNNAKTSGLENIQVIEEKNYSINGLEVLFIHWKATINNVNVDFLSYLYSGSSGTVVLHTYTPTAMLDRNHKIMEDFLNGLTIKEGK